MEKCLYLYPSSLKFSHALAVGGIIDLGNHSVHIYWVTSAVALLFMTRLQKCRQICIFSMPLVFTGIYGKYGGKYGIYGKFNGQLSNISVLNNTP